MALLKQYEKVWNFSLIQNEVFKQCLDGKCRSAVDVSTGTLVAMVTVGLFQLSALNIMLIQSVPTLETDKHKSD
jgi:hypothetical protein